MVETHLCRLSHPLLLSYYIFPFPLSLPVDFDAGSEAVVDSGVDSEVSPSSPDDEDNEEGSEDHDHSMTTTTNAIDLDSTPTLMETAETLLALSAKQPKMEDDVEEMMRRGDTAVVFPQHPIDAATVIIKRKAAAARGKGRKTRNLAKILQAENVLIASRVPCAPQLTEGESTSELSAQSYSDLYTLLIK
jgi:hypothetical protein